MKLTLQAFANLTDMFICIDADREIFFCFENKPILDLHTGEWTDPINNNCKVIDKCFFSDGDIHDYAQLICPRKIEEKNPEDTNKYLYKISFYKENPNCIEIVEIYVSADSTDNAINKLKDQFGSDFIEIKNIKFKAMQNKDDESPLKEFVI